MKWVLYNPNVMGWISVRIEIISIERPGPSLINTTTRCVSLQQSEKLEEKKKNGEWGRGRSTKLTAKPAQEEQELLFLNSDKDTILSGSYWELTVKVNPTFSLQSFQVLLSSLLFHQILWVLHPTTTTTTLQCNFLITILTGLGWHYFQVPIWPFSILNLLVVLFLFVLVQSWVFKEILWWYILFLSYPFACFIQNCYLFCLSIRVLCCFLFGEIGLLFFLEEVWFLGEFCGSRI